MLQNNKWIILLVIITGLLFRLLYLYHPFWGLEYEDSYIFSTVSRSINLNYDFSFDKFYTKTGVFGTLLNENKTETISGHNIFFPLLLSAFNIITGYDPKNVLLVNTILSLVTIFFTLKTFDLISPANKMFLWFGLVYTTIPFLSIYNSSGLSETFSSVLVVGTVFFAFKTKHSLYRDYKIVTLYVIFITLSIYIKRDNLVLLIIPCIELFHSLIVKRKEETYVKLAILIIVGLLVITSNQIFDVGRTIKDEFADVGAVPFSFNYLYRILPVFLTSLVKTDFFGVSGILFIITLLILYKNLNSYSFILFSIIVGYLFTYSFHYRSYYFVNNEENIKTIDTLRYYTNFFPIIVVFSFYIITMFVGGGFEKKNKLFIPLAFSVIVLFNIYNLIHLREDLSNIEYEERFLPVIKVLNTVTEDDIVITDRPIIYKLFCSNKQFIIDVTKIGPEEQIQVDSMKRIKEIFVMRDEELDIRYEAKNEFFRQNNFQFIKELSNHYTLYKLK